MGRTGEEGVVIPDIVRKYARVLFRQVTDPSDSREQIGRDFAHAMGRDFHRDLRCVAAVEDELVQISYADMVARAADRRLVSPVTLAVGIRAGELCEADVAEAMQAQESWQIAISPGMDEILECDHGARGCSCLGPASSTFD